MECLFCQRKSQDRGVSAWIQHVTLAKTTTECRKAASAVTGGLVHLAVTKTLSAGASKVVVVTGGGRDGGGSRRNGSVLGQ